LLTLVLSSSDSSNKLEEPIHTHLQNKQPLHHSAMADVDPHLSLLLVEPEVARLIVAWPHVFPPCVNPPFDYRFQYENGVPLRPRPDATSTTNEFGKQTVAVLLIGA
jgi:hypothetical protein